MFAVTIVTTMMFTVVATLGIRLLPPSSGF
jgi:hypothetical protein